MMLFRRKMTVFVILTWLAASPLWADGYVYVANSYYVSPPVLVAPVFTAPVPEGAPPAVYLSGYPAYVAPQPILAPAPVVVPTVVSLPVLTVPTYVAPVYPVYSRPVIVSYGPRYHSYRSFDGPFRSWSREVIRY